jgi:N-acetylglucosamine kinase-like BadF-type ATPase
MILIADGGSTKADWVAIDLSGNEVFRTRTHGINPEILDEEMILERLVNNFHLDKESENITQIYFYGAGCGTEKAKLFLKDVFSKMFINAKIEVQEDMLAAVFAASGGNESIVCILGTGSNSCYWDGHKMFQSTVSLGYMLMDEASANYFGKQLILDYYYKRMPEEIAKAFNQNFNLDPDVIKRNLYKEESPNSYLGEFAKIMFDFKEHSYINQLLMVGFKEFYECRVIPYQKGNTVPVYFIGSIAYYFEAELKQVAQELNLLFGGVVQRPIDELIAYHRRLLNQ